MQFTAKKAVQMMVVALLLTILALGSAYIGAYTAVNHLQVAPELGGFHPADWPPDPCPNC